MRQIFYDSAMLNARLGQYGMSAKMILRAVNHGFDDMDQFDSDVNAISTEALQKIKDEKDYNIARSVFDIDNK
ncbi:MAG: hypothetical protein IPK76_26090 [Lewinellaceae bacterium]|nr:hypothetical protein [Lewinellaceae bacterium]